MKMTFIATALAITFMAAPAFADCAADLAKAEEALKTMKLDEANGTKAQDLTAKAKAALAADDEKTCATSATELLTLLGL